MIEVGGRGKGVMEMMEEGLRRKRGCVMGSGGMEEGYELKGDYSGFEMLMKVG